MNRCLVLSSMILCLSLLSSAAHATLVTIGTARYNGVDYNLIWDDDNNGNSVVWLDYTHQGEYWTNQTAWTAGLVSDLSIDLSAGYSVIWDDISWRLPHTLDGSLDFGYDGSTTRGYNITSSEMGHLFYEELGNKGLYAVDGTTPQDGWGLTHTGDFQHLIKSRYWSDTEYGKLPVLAWTFNLSTGDQRTYHKWDGRYYGLAIRSGQVSLTPTPEPASCLLFGIGLLGLAGITRRGRRSHFFHNS